MELLEYIRDENRKPIGCVVAIKMEYEDTPDHRVLIGASLQHPKLDRWNRVRGQRIARNRAVKQCSFRPHPDRRMAVVLAVSAMLERAERYYHTSPDNVTVGVIG